MLQKDQFGWGEFYVVFFCCVFCLHMDFKKKRLIVLTKNVQFLPFTEAYSSSSSSYQRNSPGEAVILLAREFFLGFLPPV